MIWPGSRRSSSRVAENRSPTRRAVSHQAMREAPVAAGGRIRTGAIDSVEQTPALAPRIVPLAAHALRLFTRAVPQLAG